MDLNELINSGRVPVAPLVKELTQKVFILEAKMDVLIGLQVQTVAALEGRPFEDVLAGVQGNFEKQMEEANRKYLEALANNVQ